MAPHSGKNEVWAGGQFLSTDVSSNGPQDFLGKGLRRHGLEGRAINPKLMQNRLGEFGQDRI
jgi:hypothetical protein